MHKESQVCPNFGLEALHSSRTPQLRSPGTKELGSFAVYHPVSRSSRTQNCLSTYPYQPAVLSQLHLKSRQEYSLSMQVLSQSNRGHYLPG